jgi:diacylglycerol O-acyltransferase
VERLSGLDASYLYTESPALHMHTLKIGILDVREVPGGYSFERVKEVLAAHLHLLPPFRRRVIPVPFGLNHPVWIEDERFDIDHHVRLTRVGPPGGQRELDEVISQIASTPLDRDRPLWEVWVVEDLDDGHVAFVAKLHHTAADGVAASAMLANIMRLEPGDLEPEPPVVPWRPEPVPGRRELVLAAVRDLVVSLLRLPALIYRTARNVRRMVLVRREADDDDLPPGAFAGPRTSFNQGLTARRAFGSITLPLEDFRRVKSAFGCTINDVVLTVVAGSVREYLEDRGEPHDEPLVAAVPVSSEAPGTVRLLGNKVSNMFTSLRIDIDDPVERLHTISRVTSTAKDLQNALGVETMEQWVEYSPPKPYAWIWHRFVPRLKRPPINAIVSNVPGPKQPFYIAGARMTGLFSVGPILEGVGLNVTVWSYLDNMNFSALGCPDTLPDIHCITEGLRHALDELVKAASSV